MSLQPLNLHHDFDCCLTLDDLGQEIRRVWVDLARQDPRSKPSHLIEWDELDEQNRAIDRKIGQALLKLILTNTICKRCNEDI